MYRAIGHYITCDDALCTDCFEEHGGEEGWKASGGFEGWTEPLAIFGDTESDTPTHCVNCGACIDHALTDDGYAYVLQAVFEDFTNGKQNPVVVQWIDTYGEYAGDDFEVPGGNEVHVGDLFELHAVLPRDMTWAQSDRPDIRQHAQIVGWC